MTTHQRTDQVDSRRRAPVAGAPWLPRSYVPRRLLWSLLDASSRHPVTMVVAPAGAGKTLGVAGWLEQSRLDQDATWLDATSTTGPEALARVLDEARRTSDTPRLVVVDDAHLLPAASVRHVDARLDDDPGSLRVVLLTRWDLALTRLVPELMGHLTVLRGDVLRLTRDEAVTLVEEHVHAGSPEVRDAIIAKADGWCAPLVLAARASAVAPDGSDLVRRCTGAGPGIADLVAGETFTALTHQERHLLLCTAAEPALTTDVAVHLTGDQRAGDVLATLESTGLLVHRVVDPGPGGADRAAGETRFRIHPLLLEVARRRLATGGGDVRRANAAVLRAARLDLACGSVAVAFRRLLAVDEYDEAAAVLAEHGPRLWARGPGRWIDVYLRGAGLGVDEHPETWTAIAWSRWALDDVEGGRHWADRVLRHVARHPGSVPELQVMSLRLHRSRSGAEPVAEVMEAARACIEGSRSLFSLDPYLPLFLLELGVAENWLGDHAAAEGHLSDAILASRTYDLVAVTAEAQSHLALTQFMAGREQACSEIALQCLSLCDDPAVSTATTGRAALARLLVECQAFPWTQPPTAAGLRPNLPPPPDDLTALFWRRLLASRLALLDGSVAEAQQRLEVPFEVPRLPEHLRVALLLEHAIHGLVMSDRDTLRDAAGELGSVGADGERLWVLAVLADLQGDLPRAAALYREAAGAGCLNQPPTAALATVSAAQLLDYLGDPEAADELTSTAVRTTRSRRTPAPFLGWSPHGTRVGVLLARLPSGAGAGWAADLRVAFADRPGVVSTLAPRVPTARELASVPEQRMAPVLSPREHEVLNELARGSTYSDIAANLYVSENTVKTHVSSLYSKLSVGRRSQALAVARKQHLL